MSNPTLKRFQLLDSFSHVFSNSDILCQKLSNNAILTDIQSSADDKQIAYDNKLFRIMTFDRFLMSIHQKKNSQQLELTFSSPKSWDDPYEKRLFEINKKIDINNLQSLVYACCFKNVYSQSEDAAWRAYQYKDRMPLVMLHFDTHQLLKELDEQADRQGFNLYITDVQYNLSKEQINEKRASLQNPLAIEDFLSLLSLKRKAFEYEKELRMFIVFPQDRRLNNIQQNGDNPRIGISIKLSNKLLPRIIMSPLYPNNYGSHHKEIERILNEGVKTFIDNKIGKGVAQQSRLYSI